VVILVIFVRMCTTKQNLHTWAYNFKEILITSPCNTYNFRHLQISRCRVPRSYQKLELGTMLHLQMHMFICELENKRGNCKINLAKCTLALSIQMCHYFLVLTTLKRMVIMLDATWAKSYSWLRPTYASSRFWRWKHEYVDNLDYHTCNFVGLHANIKFKAIFKINLSMF
jgi:hypothetical protein